MSFQTIISWKICILHSEKNQKHSKTGGNSQKQSDIDFKSQVWRKYRCRFLFIHSNLSFLIWNISEEKFRTIGVLVIENFVFIHITKSATKPLSLYSSKFAPNLIGFWNHSELLECLPVWHILYVNRRGVPIVLKRQSTSSILWRHYRYQTQTRYGTSLTFVREVEVYVNAHRMIANVFLLLALVMAAGDVEL